MVTTTEVATMLRADRRRSGLARLFDTLVALTILAALALTLAGASAPRVSALIEPAAVSLNSGHAFTLSPGLATHWPYTVPSHPDSTLSPADIQVTEDGRPIGVLQPSHDLIREQGGGLFNLWQGELWFSPSDDSDPRTNGRTYRVDVQTRLEPSAATARDWLLLSSLVLLVGRLSPFLIRRTIRATVALERLFGIGWLARRIPLTFGRSYMLAVVVALGCVAWGRLAHPMPFVLEADSLGYIRPGLVWASGGDMTGQSARDLGYPWLTLVAVRLGSLAVLAKLQLAAVIAGLACILGVLYLGAASLRRRLVQWAAVPTEVLALAAAGMAVAYVALLSAHDLFVLDVDSAMAEAPHLFPTALALVLYVVGCIAANARIRLVMLILASLSAYTSAMFKPHSLLVVVLCVVSLAVAAISHRRSLRSPVVLAVGLMAAISAAALHRFDAKVTPLDNDFGPKTLFCNHLDVIAPVFDTTTPERLRVRDLAREVLSRKTGWPVMGFDGDGCMYDASFDAALAAVSRSEGATTGQWEQREFVKAVARNPVGYARVIVRQTWAYLMNPVNGIDTAVRASLTSDDRKGLDPFAGLINMSLENPDAVLHNWVSLAFPHFGAVMKGALRAISALFAPVTLCSTALALVALVRYRKADRRPEIVLVTTGLFVAAFAATTILAHTFDIARYATDLLPFSLLWWTMGMAYLIHLVILTATSSHRRPQPNTGKTMPHGGIDGISPSPSGPRRNPDPLAG